MVISKASLNTLNVVRNYTVIKMETFADIVNGGNKQEIIQFLKTKNLFKQENGFNFKFLYWLLKDKEFFSQAVDVLRQRCVFDQTLWGYSLFHKHDLQSIREYMASFKDSHLKNYFGYGFKSNLVEFDDYDQEFRIFDYYPMINARVHQLGGQGGEKVQQWSLNKTYKNTYSTFLRAMIDKGEMKTSDQLSFIYYLLLQDRISECL